MSIDWTEFAGSDGEQRDEFKWNNPGDELVGEVIDIRVVDTKFGRKPVGTFRCPDGTEVEAWLGAANLSAQCAREGLSAGDKVKITFTGTEDTGKGNPLKKFTVQVKRDGAPAAAPAAPAPAPAADSGDPWGF